MLIGGKNMEEREHFNTAVQKWKGYYALLIEI